MAKAKILFVEDSTTQGNTIKSFLEKSGYDVTWVQEGKSAIKTAKTEPFDIILLDLILPDIDGYEVCRWLRVNQNTRGIPIIMLTVKDSKTDMVAGLESGANDYLPKPFNEIELNARIYACLRTKALQDELRQKNQELERLLERVEVLAMTDPLTDLLNRRRFETLLETEIRRTLRYKTPLSCLMIDIDHFKNINDEYGHEVGDSVLHEISQILKKSFREVDVLARWGGEEFIVLLPQTNQEGAYTSASRILKAISSHQFKPIPDKPISVSIGVSSAPDPAIKAGEDLINQADLAMYEAKIKGRNRLEIS